MNRCDRACLGVDWLRNFVSLLINVSRMNSAEHAAPLAVSTLATSLTALADRYAAGDETVLGEITPEVYRELKNVARNHLRNERSNHTLQATAVVNEVYARMCDNTGVLQKSRGQFFRLASRVMRNLLVDYARARNTEKRGGGASVESLDQTAMDYHEHCAEQLFGGGAGAETQLNMERDFLSLDDALRALRSVNPRQAEVVDLRFFGNLSVEETAQTLAVSVATVKRDWTIARAFMQQFIDDERDAQA
jgi:RNA polymerase sigma factor (sigma-70 family)